MITAMIFTGTFVIMDDFLLRALAGGLLVAVFSAPLGCLMVWQRMSYFGATLSHAALLGIALGLVLKIPLPIGILIVSTLVSALLMLLQGRKSISNDTILGILAHGSLAAGLIALSLLPGLRMNLMGYLFGDILTISRIDLLWMLAGTVTILLTLTWLWRPLLSTIVQAELARVDGYNLQRLQLCFLLLLSIAVAVSMQVIGVLLIVSLLIIPAATARPFARSPEQMMMLAAVAGMLSVGGGLLFSLTFDTPTGPSIVIASCALFATGHLIKRS